MQTVIPTELKELAIERAKHFPVEGFLDGQGPLNPRFMLIGEAPGETELLSNHPFTGRAGKELDKFLDKIGVNRNEAYISSVFKSRPWRERKVFSVQQNKRITKRANRPPTKQELLAHAPVIDYEIKTVDPPLILTMGNTALTRLLGNKGPISNVHGRIYRGPLLFLPHLDAQEYAWTEKEYLVYPTYHPASVLYNRKLEETIYEDLVEFKKLIELIE